QHPFLRQTFVLGIRTQIPTGPGKHLVSLPKSDDLFADGFNLSGELLPEYFLPRSPEPKTYSHKELQPERKFETSQLTVRCGDGRRMDPYQDFIVLGSGLLYLLKLKNIRRPIFWAYNCFHEFPPMGIRKIPSSTTSCLWVRRLILSFNPACP